MSDELEARMWDEEPSTRYDMEHATFYESAFASSEQMDRTPLLSEETYAHSELTLNPEGRGEHCHWRPREPPSAVPQLVAALVLCGCFMVCELIGGYLAGSLSVMSDAAHMLSDCGGFGLALLAFHCAKRPPGTVMTYGYKRAEVLGAMVSVLLIWALTAIFVVVAASRLHSGDYDIDPDTMMWVSGAGVGFNVVLAVVLHGCGGIAHHHSHGGAACSHTHEHTQTSKRFKWFSRHKENGVINGDYSLKDLPLDDVTVPAMKDRNINLRAALIHVIGDLIQSCGVLLASIIIKLYPSAKWVDPVCTFVFGILVLLTSHRVVRDALRILMQATPNHFRYRSLIVALTSVPGVRHVHSLHVWTLSTHHVVLSAHVAIDQLSDPEHILRTCQSIARNDFEVQSATFQVERYTETMVDCPTCLEQPAVKP